MRKRLQVRLILCLPVVAAVAGAFASQAFAVTAARTVFRGGPIYTAEPGAPPAEAVAVGENTILYVGPAAGVEPFINKKTRVIDLQGQALFPGFIDSDARLFDYAEAQREIDLSGVRGYDEIVRRVAQAIRKTDLPTTWIFGRGWNENEWTVKDPIRLVNLQAVSGTHPVVLFHGVDDALIANTVVLETAGATDDPPDPPGGRFLRTRGGMPTGVLLDAALDFIRPVLPQKTPEEMTAFCRAAAESCAAHGITQVHCMDVTAAGWDALDRVARSKEGLPVRVFGVVAADEPGMFDRIENPKRRSDGGVLLSIRGAQVKVDGGLDTRGAFVYRPYEDEPAYTGHLIHPPEALGPEVARIVAAGFQPVLRATGDAAVSAALDAFALAYGDSTGPGPGQLPPRIESAALVAPGDVARLRAQGVSISVQPWRVRTDQGWIEDRLGTDRKVHMHAWKTLQNAGIPVMISTGAPAGPLDPIAVFHAAVTRQNAAGRPAAGWMPEEKLSREEALQAMTRIPAAAAGEEKEGGTIAVGKRADLTVLSKDIMQVPEKDILSARVTLTMVGGRIVHEKMSNP